MTDSETCSTCGRALKLDEHGEYSPLCEDHGAGNDLAELAAMDRAHAEEANMTDAETETVSKGCDCGPVLDGVTGCDYNGCSIWCDECRPFCFGTLQDILTPDQEDPA